MDSSEFLEFLTTRTSVREYGSTPITDAEIEYILSCASTAPSAGNLESWDVILVKDEDVRLCLCDAAFNQQHIEQAPVILAVCANYVRSMSRYGERGILYALQDASIAGTYMMLAAHSLGLQSCWTGAFDDEDVREVLDLPQHIRPVVLLAIGRGHPAPTRTSRMAAGEHVHNERW
ncbi:MAG: nitroreductase family protein [Methanoregula sp.]|jgi:nitroreductase|nr:nitroreductase family protein [Methanoregula sp.]MDD5025028.1 nitroreductase family protein [Methanoregula sp.]MDD5186736.1 nitroreductase family protein [Methanoregula sp.]